MNPRHKLIARLVVAVSCISAMLFLRLARDFGFYHSNEVYSISISELRIAYLPFKGDYTKAWDIKYNELVEKLKKRGFSNCTDSTTVGIYYDNPDTEKAEDLRSVVGIEIPSEFELGDNNDGIRIGTIGNLSNATAVVYPSGNIVTMTIALYVCYGTLEDYFDANHKGAKLSPRMEMYRYEPKHVVFVQTLWEEGHGLMSDPPPELAIPERTDTIW